MGQDWADKDFYRVLGVEPTNLPEEITKSYRTCMMIVHPDRNTQNPEIQATANKLAQAYSEAYEALSNPVKRAEYARLRARSGQRPQDQPPHPGPHDQGPAEGQAQEQEQAQERAREREAAEEQAQQERARAEEQARKGGRGTGAATGAGTGTGTQARAGKGRPTRPAAGRLQFSRRHSPAGPDARRRLEERRWAAMPVDAQICPRG